MTAIKDVVNGELGLSIPVAGLKKDNRHRTNTLLYGDPVEEFGMKVTDELFRLLVEIQDEVHRFAITFHKKKRSKSQTKSQLDDIQGVGPVTKQKILQHFGSVTRARRAEKQEWIDLLGSRSGTKVYEYFHAKITP
jgi:excinuclease ABC subunit C